MKSTLSRDQNTAQLRAHDDQLPGKQPPPFQLKASEPALKEGESYSWAPLQGGKPFMGGEKDKPETAVNIADVHQGGMDNCGLFATMAGVAQRYPKLISEAIKPKGDGTFDVTLYLKDYLLGPRLPKVVNVTNNFPMQDANNTAYAQRHHKSAERDELWPLLIEKAVAKVKGGYGKTKMREEDAMLLITGKDSNLKSTWAHSKKTQWADMKEALDNHQVVTAATLDFKKESKDIQLKSIKADLVGPHAYVVLSLNESSKTIKLHNPWGGDNPTVEITLDQFDELMKNYTIMDK